MLNKNSNISNKSVEETAIGFKPTSSDKIGEIKGSLATKIDTLKEGFFDLNADNEIAIKNFRIVLENIKLVENEITEIIKLLTRLYGPKKTGFDTIKLALKNSPEGYYSVKYEISSIDTIVDFQISFTNLYGTWITLFFHNGEFDKIISLALKDIYVLEEREKIFKEKRHFLNNVFNNKKMITQFYESKKDSFGLEEASRLYVKYFTLPEKTNLTYMLNFLKFLDAIPTKIIPELYAFVEEQYEVRNAEKETVDGFEPSEVI